MPTMLWRVLNSMGYPKGKEPRYYWNIEQLGDGTLVYVEAVVLARGDDPNWSGWSFGSKGRTPEEGASRATFAVLGVSWRGFQRSSLLQSLEFFLGVIPTLLCGVSLSGKL
jgi:hypothetical protein